VFTEFTIPDPASAHVCRGDRTFLDRIRDEGSVPHHTLAYKATGEHNTEKAEQAVERLHGLARRASDALPEGTVPTALPHLLEAIGVAKPRIRPAIAAIVEAALRATLRAAKQRTLQVTHHWQLVGIPLAGVGSIRHPETVCCQACRAERRHLFHVESASGEEEAAIVDSVMSAQLDHIAARAKGKGLERAERLLMQAIADKGCYVCFFCAAPAVGAAHEREEAAAEAQRQADHAAAEAATAGRQNMGHQLGRGAPRTTRRPPKPVYTPTNDKARLAAAKAHKAERLRERRVAITAELRAISIEPDTQRMRLTRVTAAQVRATERSRRDVGGIRLQGAIFPREGKQWMVIDVAPSNSSEDGHTVAYAIDIAKRTTCAGPLDEHAVEFEVATVKEAIALSQAGPSAEVPPPDPTEAEPGSESTDFQVTAEDGVFATPAQRADAFLNGMAAPPQPARNGAFVTPAQSVDVALDRMAEPLAALEAREPSQREPLQPPPRPPMPPPLTDETEWRKHEAEMARRREMDREAREQASRDAANRKSDMAARQRKTGRKERQNQNKRWP